MRGTWSIIEQAPSEIRRYVISIIIHKNSMIVFQTYLQNIFTWFLRVWIK